MRDPAGPGLAPIAAPIATPIPFAGGGLDRAEAVRTDPARLAACIARGARALRLDGFDPVIGADGALVWAPLEPGAGEPAAEWVFLGLDAAGVAHLAEVPAASPTAAPPSPALWAAMAALAPVDLATYGVARALTLWHARHRFCPCCGGVTRTARGGWQRRCVAPGCGAEHFPRVDPVVIMTVAHPNDRGDDLLLGRQPRFPPGRYSALAGFVEPGESVEEAVAREVFEEAGVRVSEVWVRASQPWPFPASLMLGCHALATTRAITIDPSELEDARWFSRAEVAAAMAGAPEAAFAPPPRHAIAWHLLAAWLRDGAKFSLKKAG